MIEILVGLLVLGSFTIPAYFLGKYLVDPFPNDPYASKYDHFMRLVSGSLVLIVILGILLIAYVVGEAVLY